MKLSIRYAAIMRTKTMCKYGWKTFEEAEPPVLACIEVTDANYNLGYGRFKGTGVFESFLLWEPATPLKAWRFTKIYKESDNE